MHLKSCPKLVHSDLRLDAAGVQTPSQRSSLFVSQQVSIRRTCGSNHGNISNRLPLSIISTNTLRSTNPTNNIVGSIVPSLWLKVSSSPALQLVVPSPGCDNNTLRLYQTATEDGDTPLDIWTVIKPGHVREKIAIFASETEPRDCTRGSERTSAGTSGSQDRTPAVCMNNSTMTGFSRAAKAKGSWEENCSPKRRRRSGKSHNQNLQQAQRTRVPDSPQCVLKPSVNSTQQSGSGHSGGEAVTSGEEEEHKVSVVEIVAFLEQKASEQQLDSKPLLALQRSSTSITLSRGPHPDVREGSEVRGGEPETMRVLDMVAKLESECLRRRTEGDLSRSNSLRRTVGRVLLAAGDQSPASSQPALPLSSVKLSMKSSSSSSLPEAKSQIKEPISCSETARPDTRASASTPPSSPFSGEFVSKSQKPMGRNCLQTQSPVLETVAPPPLSEEEEPLPGLLFLSSHAEHLPKTDSSSLPTDSEPQPPHHKIDSDLQPAPSQPRPLAVSSSTYSTIQSDKGDETGPEAGCVEANPLSRHPSVSQDFLEMRQRVQQLLAPQPYLAMLPHHLLVKIFLLLPTQSLAALKCTCHYFKFVIENYGVRPADSLWVSDPRYRDDPCKQCKKRYGRGDVSLCRWHHKPYCQALPYGPGYWMCCHGAHRDTPGCNVGLHDNRWVPPFHSVNLPIYRRTHNNDND
ncbi:F-box only protein 34 [Channa argus]|uniref:F-box only protein 34 n=1 Tax=Channa argus TaxID=215402 RepID=A0A6G1QE42_CHAAH|nr:F-box only protein 34 [Channa argus]